MDPTIRLKGILEILVIYHHIQQKSTFLAMVSQALKESFKFSISPQIIMLLVIQYYVNTPYICQLSGSPRELLSACELT